MSSSAGDSRVRGLAKAVLPERVRRTLREQHLTVWPPVGRVRFGSLRRTAPISREFGYDRGLPIDRHYIERFLAEHARDVRGVALEFQDDAYLRRFGGDEVTAVDVLNVEPDYPGTTIAADIAVADGLPTDRFDCIVCTQVLQLVYDLYGAVRNLRSMLRPGGVLLATVPTITRITREPGAWEDHWRMTSASARRLFGDVFGPDSVDVQWFGNPLAAIAFLMGLAAEDLKGRELEVRQPEYELVVCVRAVRR